MVDALLCWRDMACLMRWQNLVGAAWQQETRCGGRGRRVTGLRSRDHARHLPPAYIRRGRGARWRDTRGRRRHKREDTARGGRSGGGRRSSLRLKEEEESGDEAGSREVRGEVRREEVAVISDGASFAGAEHGAAKAGHHDRLTEEK
ncbi:hypothetical protein Scep_025820 [Stephania cephalantha]|uniref:Uncharacterized protein n=1 Tax=Stephania cephalantha TaxID=152367 RepID=A0AAP0HRX7_9MAGN